MSKIIPLFTIQWRKPRPDNCVRAGCFGECRWAVECIQDPPCAPISEDDADPEFWNLKFGKDAGEVPFQ